METQRGTKIEQARQNVRFEEGGVHHPMREEMVRPSKEWRVPLLASIQCIRRFHTKVDKQVSERKLLSNSKAIKEFTEVKQMCDH